MKRLTSLLLCTICVQFVSPALLFAEGEETSDNGSAQIMPSDQSGSVLINEDEFSGSVLHENEKIDLKNDSESSVSSAVSSVSEPVRSALLIRLTEVAWAGSDLSSADEWLELSAFPAATGAVITEPLNLRGWRIAVRKDIGETTIAAIDRDLFVASGSVVVIANNGASVSRLEEEPAYISTSVSLPNTKLQIRLYDAPGVLVDEVDDFVGAPFAGSNPSAVSGLPKATMERISVRQPGTDKANWQTAVTSRGFDESANMLGSPGFPTEAVADIPPSLSTRPLVVPFISEVLPDPAGTGEEWIELANTGSVAVDLNGWMLQSGSRSFTFASGTILPAGGYATFPASKTGLQLPNTGGEVRLLFGTSIIDHILYTETPDGVSVGRAADGPIRPFCVPTPDTGNQVLAPVINLTGFLKNLPNPTSLNLAVVALSGSIAGGSCIVDYGDGFISNSCNPPSHSMKKTGHILMNTTVMDFCGTTVTRQDDVQVVAGASTKKPSTTVSTNVCRPTATGGVIVSEFLAAPAGSDEWIELQNITGDDVDLCGWSVDDAIGGSSPYLLNHIRMPAGQYLLVRSAESHIALNNDADTVRLIAPDGQGGTGVILSIPYQDADTDHSIALREDGLYLATPFPTPGAQNRFVSFDTTPGSSPVILSAVMPNPVGVDQWDEWIELANLTGRPQWLNGWRIEDGKGHRLELNGQVLAKRETLRIALYKTGFTLTNNDSHLRLIDDQGIIRSVLSWDTASEGHSIRRSLDCTEEPLHGLSMTGILAMDMLPGYLSYKNEHENYVSALIKNKNTVLKKCSDGSSSVLVDGADIALLLLERGFAFADPTDHGPRHAEFAVYEQVARDQRHGIWADPAASGIADAWKAGRVLDDTVAREGLQLTVSRPSGLLLTGSVISVETNVPADLWVRQGTGAYRRFDGEVFVSRDTTVTFLGTYAFQTIENQPLETSVVLQSYTVRKPFYPSCIRISEVYPSPKKGENEWVELENVCMENVRLLGWSMDDERGEGSKPFIFGNINISSGAVILLSGSLLPLSLNNGGDSLTLFDPHNRVQSTISFQKTTAGRAWALLGDRFCQTARATPLQLNICEMSAPKSKKAGLPKAVKLTAGIAIKYLAASLLDDDLYTKSDQNYHLIEGLNGNVRFKISPVSILSILAALLFILGISTLATGVWLYGRKYRLWQ
jgi:hypothetical protein